MGRRHCLPKSHPYHLCDLWFDPPRNLRQLRKPRFTAYQNAHCHCLPSVVTEPINPNMLMNIASLGNFFGPDTLIIFLIVLLLFGAKKLPELAKGLGQAVREFSKAKDDFQSEISRAPEPPPAPAPQPLQEPKIEVAKDEHAHTTTHTI